MSHYHPTRHSLLALAIVSSATSCGLTRKSQRSTPDKTIDKAEQTNPAPVLRRTDGLPEDADYLWFSGRAGSDAPGPSTYWIDAQVEMTDVQVAALRDLGVETDASIPAVVPELAEHLDGIWHEAPAVATRIAAEGWSARVWVAEGSPVLAISLIGEG